MRTIIEHEHFDMKAFKTELHRLGYDKVLRDNALLGVIVDALASEICGLQARLTELETFDSPVTLLEHAQMKARIEAVAAIPALELIETYNHVQVDAANEMRAQFRKALELEVATFAEHEAVVAHGILFTSQTAKRLVGDFKLVIAMVDEMDAVLSDVFKLEKYIEASLG
jgi:hypothetical protein